MVILCVSRMITTSVEVDWHKWSVLHKSPRSYNVITEDGHGFRRRHLRKTQEQFHDKDDYASHSDENITSTTQRTSQAADPIMPAVTHPAGPETVEQPVAQRRSSRPVKVPQRLIEQC